MKKLIILGVLCIGIVPGGSCQDLRTWTEELAAYQTLEHTTAQGYRTMTAGLTTIDSIREDEYQRHSAYYQSLFTVKKIFVYDQTSIDPDIGANAVASPFPEYHSATEQLAFDVEKLASIKSTLQEMYQGYEDLQKGYTHIRDIVKDNFNLHEVFLDALWVVSASVRNDPRLDDIFNTEYRLVALYKTATAGVGGNLVWNSQELGYIKGSFGAVLRRSQQAIDELTMVTTDNELRMSDAERLFSLDRIDTELREELAFMERFNNELTIEASRRNQESNDINTLRSLYGISN